MATNTPTVPPLTIGQVAHICQVAHRTARGWVDSGLLPGYRLPGSKHRRVKADNLKAFLTRHNMDGLAR
jgi:excisionase family DNA binding protein